MLRTKIFLTIAALLSSLLFAGMPVVVHAQVDSQLQCGINAASGQGCGASGPSSDSCGDNNPSSQDILNCKIATVVNIISSVAGVVAVIMIIIAGFRYVSSGGSDETVKSAKSTILYAVIGLVVIAFAQIIVRFVLDKSKV